jgi:hypothetical protein
MFSSNVKGKITIEVEKVYGRLNSVMRPKGLAKDDEVLLSTLFMHFVQQAEKMNRDPSEILSKNLKKNLSKNAGDTNPGI